MVMVKVWGAEDQIHVRLNRPEKANAYNGEMLTALRSVFQQIGGNGTRALVLSGEGRNFCSGADLRWIHESAAQGLSSARAAAELIFAMYEALLQVEVPVIGEAHGNVFGGGVGLVSACDWVVATPGTTFCLSEVRLGMIPGIIAPLVERKLGLARYNTVAQSGSPFDARSAMQWGLVQAVSEGRHAAFNDENIAEINEQRRALRGRFAQERDALVSATSACWVTREATQGREAFLNS